MSIDATHRLISDLVEVEEKLTESSPELLQSQRLMNLRAAVIAIGGELEKAFCHSLISSCQIRASSSVVTLINQKVIFRKYHTMFQWDNLKPGDAKSFFGKDFQKAFDDREKSDSDFKEALRVFLELGQQRNKLAHGSDDFDSTLSLTEIKAKFDKALKFIELYFSILNDIDKPLAANQSGTLHA